MKKLLVLLMMFTVFVSCKEDKKTEVDSSQDDKTIVAQDGKTPKQSDGLVAVQGDFIYYADAAVLKTPTKIYGVVVDEKMQELQTQVKAYKKLDTDMVPVTIRGRMFKKDPSEEGWEDRIEIKEILKVSPPNPEVNDVIKIGSK
ncbi:hypothetical protein [Psychroserpens damuponensis]|uniref:hypothetical protein n=1 Tax=Psychroserpens damuponensis TaxID=943936 RepID=UPI00058E77AE|nr:hypothetical protein [Psychroserpens damuponensis]